MSLLLAGIFWILSQATSNQESPVTAILTYLALINVVLAAFNLIPGFPLDGGRVLRSIIWSKTGSLTKATNTAATVGRIFGWGLIILGLFQLFQGNFIGGIWLMFIGWFLSNAADSGRRAQSMREWLAGIKVSDMLNPDQLIIGPETTVSQLVDNVFRRQHGRAVPVCQNGRLLGIVSITDVKELSQENWDKTTVKEIMTSKPLYTISSGDNLSRAMALITQHDVNQVLVVKDAKCEGLISRADIMANLQKISELGIKKRIQE
jgi:predicted transcriptional regulator